MRVVYEAENLIDAHLIKGLLAQDGIDSYIRGEHLIGAIGELPAIGLIAVMVADEDVASARSVILDWDNAEPVDGDASSDGGSFLA